MTTVADVLAALHEHYPPRLAEDWDVNGLVVGDPEAEVTAVLLAVDPVMDVVREARSIGAQLVVTHHPLILRGVTTVATTTAKGAVVHELISSGIALITAHTNADAAAGGVADGLADAIGVVSTVPLIPSEDPEHGTGRVGVLNGPLTLGEFAQRVADVLPATAHGVRVAGDVDAMVTTVAVVGGAGDAFLEQVRAVGADVYVTADLRHHPASEARELAALGDGRPFLVDVSHAASESAWLTSAARYLKFDCDVTAVVSTINTDPWSARYDARQVAHRSP